MRMDITFVWDLEFILQGILYVWAESTPFCAAEAMLMLLKVIQCVQSHVSGAVRLKALPLT
jgi:hypothetical protein